MARGRRSSEWVVYKAINLVNGKLYVGFTGQSMAGRRAGHKAAALNPARRKRMIISKAIYNYGIEMFRFTVLVRFATKLEAAREEVRLIALWRPAYNQSKGGETALPPSKENLALFMEGRKQASEKRKRPVICLTDGRIFTSVGEAAAAYGVQGSTLTGAINGWGLVRSEHLLAYYTGVEKPFAEPLAAVEEVKARMRQVQIATVRRTEVVCINDGRRFRSVTDAAEAIGARIGDVSNVIRRKLAHHKGWVFRYLNDPDQAMPPELTQTSTGRMRIISDKVIEARKNQPPRKTKPVRCLSDGMEFSSAAEAANHYGLSDQNVWFVASGKSRRGYGFHRLRFEYIGAINDGK